MREPAALDEQADELIPSELRVLWENIGRPFCKKCGEPMIPKHPDDPNPSSNGLERHACRNSIDDHLSSGQT